MPRPCALVRQARAHPSPKTVGLSPATLFAAELKTGMISLTANTQQLFSTARNNSTATEKHRPSATNKPQRLCRLLTRAAQPGAARHLGTAAHWCARRGLRQPLGPSPAPCSPLFSEILQRPH